MIWNWRRMALRARRHAGQVGAGEPDPARSRGQQPQDQAAQGGFAAAGLAHQPQGLAGSQGKAHPVHRLEQRPPAPGTLEAEMAAEIFGFQEFRHGQ